MKATSGIPRSDNRRPKRRSKISCPPGARLPCDAFFAELSHAATDNTIYVKVQTEPYRSRRQMLMAKIHYEYNLNPHLPIPLDEIVPQMFVVIKSHETYGIFFFRAQVVRVDEAQVIHCIKIDEGSDIMVLPDHVYRITQELLEEEVTVLKCFLDGLGLFDGLPDIQLAYHLLRMSDLNPEPFYPAKIVRNYRGTPVIRILWKNGLTMTSAVQQWITYFCSIPKPMVGDEIEGSVIHVDSFAHVWLQPSDKANLIYRIQDILMNFDYSTVPRAFGSDPTENGRYNPRTLESMDPWKRKFFTVPTGVYISRYYKDGAFYRCTLRRSINKERIEVEFMDFGNVEIVPRHGIFSCKDVDENLAYIPPMCFKTKLYGLDRINEDYFCRQINETILLKVITEAVDDESYPAVEVYNWDSTISVNQEILTSSSSTEMEIGACVRQRESKDDDEDKGPHHHYDYLM